MRSMNLKFANTLESYTVESATARSTLPPKRCTLESSHAIHPPLQIIHAEPDIDFFSPTLSKVIWSRVLLLAPHHLPSVVRSRVLAPIRPSTPPCSSLRTACHHVLWRAAIRSLQAHWVADTRSRGAMVHALPLVYLQAHGPPSRPHSL